MNNSIDTTKVSNVTVEGIDMSDYPDFVDSFITAADYDGMEMNEMQLDQLNDEHSDYVQEKAFEQATGQ